MSTRRGRDIWPGKPWSLLDMLELKAKPFVEIITRLAGMSSMIRTINDHKPEMAGGNTPLSTEMTAKFSELVAAFTESCEPLEVNITKRAAERIQDQLAGGHLYWVELGVKLETLSQTFRDEMDTSKLFALNPRVANFFALASDAFSDDVVLKFPKAEYDLEEAGKCLATARNTASVFHLMRAVESVLQELCRGLQIENVDRRWGFLLSDLNGKIKAMPDDERKAQWQAASTYLFQVKEVWRNDTMHPKNTYTDEEAREVFEATRVFIKHAAKLA